MTIILYHNGYDRITRNHKKTKNMGELSWQGSSVRTSICMDRTLYDWAREYMEKNGYGNNFSAYISAKAREHREQERARTLEEMKITGKRKPAKRKAGKSVKR